MKSLLDLFKQFTPDEHFDAIRSRLDRIEQVRRCHAGHPAGEATGHEQPVDRGQLRRARVDLPGRQPVAAVRHPAAGIRRDDTARDPLLRPVRAVDGLRGPPPVADPGGVPPDRRQHRVGRRGSRPDRRDHHRRGPDHGHGLLRVRPRRVDHDQEHRRGDGAGARAGHAPSA